MRFHFCAIDNLFLLFQHALPLPGFIFLATDIYNHVLMFNKTGNNFFLILENTCPFCGATDTPVLDFWLCLSRVSRSMWIRRFYASSHVCNGFFRFTSGAPPATIFFEI